MVRILLLFIYVLLLSSFSQMIKARGPDSISAAGEKTNYSVSDNILFADYRLFMIYTRDSIMREILSEELADFCNFYAPQYICISLNWSIPINLTHDEIVEILTNYEEYVDHYNFLILENNDYYVDTSYLIYRTTIFDKNGINIFPDLNKLDPQLKKNIEFRFGTYNSWNVSLDKQIINKILSLQQIEAYRDWNMKIGLKKAKEITKNKIINMRYTNSYGS